MHEYRETEEHKDLDNVASTAAMIPAMVAVLTGGDPLLAPNRTRILIERLAAQKALVLDTSGVGNIDALMPDLLQHDVHVRVSLDTIDPSENQRLRPGNPIYGLGASASLDGGTRTIEKCLHAGVPVSVQTVVTAWNENRQQWTDVRDWLIGRGVRNWVIHVMVKGGSARKLIRAARKQKRPKTIEPSHSVYSSLWRLVSETMDQGLEIDIRCTDTDTTPNSILLVGSKGDLFTEGLAHNGKVCLYRAGDARPDLAKALWPHLDRFGHARRYLNWNPWFFDGQSLEKICLDVPAPEPTAAQKHAVEIEAKHRVPDPAKLRDQLIAMGYTEEHATFQRDEYFDTESRLWNQLDYAVRLRKEGGTTEVALKGPRVYPDGDDYARIELELRTDDEARTRRGLANKGLKLTWFFEKRRTKFVPPSDQLPDVFLDEVPEIGHFVEFEGELETLKSLRGSLGDALGRQERHNNRDLYVAHRIDEGDEGDTIRGAHF